MKLSHSHGSRPFARATWNHRALSSDEAHLAESPGQTQPVPRDPTVGKSSCSGPTSTSHDILRANHYRWKGFYFVKESCSISLLWTEGRVALINTIKESSAVTPLAQIMWGYPCKGLAVAHHGGGRTLTNVVECLAPRIDFSSQLESHNTLSLLHQEHTHQALKTASLLVTESIQ